MPKPCSLLWTSLGVSLLIAVGIIVAVTKMKEDFPKQSLLEPEKTKLLGNNTSSSSSTAHSMIYLLNKNTQKHGERSFKGTPRLSHNASIYENLSTNLVATNPHLQTVLVTPLEVQLQQAPTHFSPPTSNRQNLVTWGNTQPHFEFNDSYLVSDENGHLNAVNKMEINATKTGNFKFEDVANKEYNISHFSTPLLFKLQKQTTKSFYDDKQTIYPQASTITSFHKLFNKTDTNFPSIPQSDEIETKTTAAVEKPTNSPTLNQPQVSRYEKYPVEYKVTTHNTKQDSLTDQARPTTVYVSQALPTMVPHAAIPSSSFPPSTPSLITFLTVSLSKASRIASTLTSSFTSTRSSTDGTSKANTLSPNLSTDVLPTTAQLIEGFPNTRQMSAYRPSTIRRVHALLTFEQACDKLEKRFGICNFNARTGRYKRKCGRLRIVAEGKRLCYRCRRTRQCGNRAKGFQR